MCEFCHKHGEGKKWYLEAQNYSLDLLSDLRRRRFVKEFFAQSDEAGENVDRLADFRRAPGFVQRLMRPLILRRMKKYHYGQVLPIEDVKAIFNFIGSIVRVPCICRESTLGREVGYCYGVSLDPDSMGLGDLAEVDYSNGPDTSSFERISTGEALTLFEEHEKEGLCHTVWTFLTPFIGGICNCDRSDCLAMRATVTYEMPAMFRAEYVASVNAELCRGCRACMRMCQFGALGYSAADRKVIIDQLACYGCGVCRSACSEEAIKLMPRREVPAVTDLW